jgi:tetratricopeptide (TPR) repeat protein
MVGLSSVRAQIPQQGGTALDASNRVGAGSINAPARRDFYPGGNFYVTGNVAGGGYFRGFSPIRDPSSLQLNLPSSSLGNFQSGSYSVQDILANRTFSSGPSPFFLPSQTASFAGSDVLSIANRPLGGALYASPQPAFGPSGRLGLPGLGSSEFTTVPGTYPGSGLSALGAAGTPLVPRSGAMLPGLDAYSPLGTSATAIQRSDSVLDTASRGLLGTGVLPGASGSLLDRPALQGRAAAPMLGPQRSTRDVLDSTQALTDYGRYTRGLLDTPRRREIDPLTGQWITREPPTRGVNPPSEASPPAPSDDVAQPPTDAQARRTSILDGPLTAEASRAAQTGPTGSAVERLFRPTGNDVFSDVQGALRWLDAARRNRRASAAGISSEATPERLAGAPAALDADSMTGARRIVSEPLTTYAGAGASRANEYTRRAEELLRSGKYYHAARNYETAARLDRGNPLIDLGWGHALIGAGEYASAVHHLLRGLERYPDLVRLNLELSQFFPDIRVLDQRRVDLEQRLAQQENYELRFLLGYMEYFGGLRNFGMEHLKRAASEAPSDSVVARIPDLLTDNPLEGLDTPRELGIERP